MKKIFLTSLLISMIVFISCKEKVTNPPDNILPEGYQQDVPWPSLADSPWPMHHHDSFFSGRSNFSGPQSGLIDWVLKISTLSVMSDSYLSTIIGRDSTIYFISYKDSTAPNCFLYAVKFNGTIKWKFAIPYDEQVPTYLEGRATSPAIQASDGTIYFADWFNNVYGVNENGTIKWKTKITRSIIGYMNIGKDGILYGLNQDGLLFAFSKEGVVLWSKQIDTKGSRWSNISFSPDGEVLYIFSTSTVFAVAKDDQIVLWQFDNGESADITLHTPIVDAQGNIYFSSHNGGTYLGFLSLTHEGKIRYNFAFPSTNSPTIDKNGNIYLLDIDGSIHSLDCRGNKRWQKNMSVGSNSSALVIDKDGFLYCINDDKNLLKFDSNGNVIWSVVVDGNSFESPAIGNDGKLYFGTVYGTSKYFYCVK